MGCVSTPCGIGQQNRRDDFKEISISLLVGAEVCSLHSRRRGAQEEKRTSEFDLHPCCARLAAAAHKVLVIPPPVHAKGLVLPSQNLT